MAIPVLALIDLAGKIVTADACSPSESSPPPESNVTPFSPAHREGQPADAQRGYPPALCRTRCAGLPRAPRPGAGPDRKPRHLDLHALNDDLDLPHVGQVCALERHTINQKTGQTSTEIVYGVTDHTPLSASPARLLDFNRDYWRIEAIMTSSTGTGTRIAAQCAPVTVPRILPACGASPSG